jgi:uncharacterized RDD family membrane protein YckC
VVDYWLGVITHHAQNSVMTLSDRNSYGGFWIRFAAYFVDFGILLIPMLLISFLVRSVTPVSDQMDQAATNFEITILSWLVCWVYMAAFLSSPWQATVGKKCCGLKVVDYNGGRISFGRASGRYFAAFFSWVLLCIGFIMIAWTSRRQGLHDMMASTLVVKSMTPNLLIGYIAGFICSHFQSDKDRG